MLCRNPFIDRGMHAYPCGQCVPCLYRRKRVWAHRIVLESFCHASSVFVTLTYSDNHLPADGGLVPGDLQLWLKRIRRRLGDQRLRYFACGEYGGATRRPHYHLALFGMSGCAQGSTNYNLRGEVECCSACSAVSETWGFGRIQLAPLTSQTAFYVAGYVSKKEESDLFWQEKGLQRPFQRMSLKPGIGANALGAVASAMMQFSLDKTEVDVPVHLRHGKFLMPLGRYLRRKLREEIGRPPETPQAVLDEVAKQMLPLLLSARESSENPSLKGQILEAGKQAALSLETRLRLKGKLK